MGMYQTGVVQIFDGEVIEASGVANSGIIDLSQLRTDNATIQVILTGTGTAKVEYLLSCDGINYSAADGVSNSIKTGITAGKVLVNFSFKLAEYMKIVITETGGANSVTVDAYLVTR